MLFDVSLSMKTRSACQVLKFLLCKRVVWHDLHFVHTALASVGGTPHKGTMMKQCQHDWDSVGVTHPRVFIRTINSCRRKIWNICDSFALYTLLWLVALRSRTASLVENVFLICGTDAFDA